MKTIFVIIYTSFSGPPGPMLSMLDGNSLGYVDQAACEAVLMGYLTGERKAERVNGKLYVYSNAIFSDSRSCHPIMLPEF